MPKLLDEFVSGFSNAIADIRQKVVEEGWFGRAVTPPAETAPEAPVERNGLYAAFCEGREVSREELYGKGPEVGPDQGYSR